MTLADNSSPTTSPTATKLSGFNNNATMAEPAPQIIPQPPKMVTKLVKVDSTAVSLGTEVAPDPVFGLWQDFQKLLPPVQAQIEHFDPVAAMADPADSDLLPSDARKLWGDITKSLGVQPKSEGELLALLEEIKAKQEALKALLKALAIGMNAPQFIEVVEKVPQDDVIVAPETVMLAQQDMADTLITPSEPAPALLHMLGEFKAQLVDVAPADLNAEESIIEHTLAPIPEEARFNEDKPKSNQPLKGRVIDFKLNAVDAAAEDNKPSQPAGALQITKPTASRTYSMVA